MGTRALENRIKKLKEIEQQQKELAEQTEKIGTEIKTNIQTKGESEVQTGNFIVRLKEVITNRFDTKAFAEEHKKQYAAYTKQQSSYRFTIV